MVKSLGLLVYAIAYIVLIYAIVSYIVNHYKLMKVTSDVVEQELSSASSAELAKRLDDLAFYFLLFVTLIVPVQIGSAIILGVSKKSKK